METGNFVAGKVDFLIYHPSMVLEINLNLKRNSKIEIKIISLPYF